MNGHDAIFAISITKTTQVIVHHTVRSRTSDARTTKLLHATTRRYDTARVHPTSRHAVPLQARVRQTYTSDQTNNTSRRLGLYRPERWTLENGKATVARARTVSRNTERRTHVRNRSQRSHGTNQRGPSNMRPTARERSKESENATTTEHPEKNTDGPTYVVDKLVTYRRMIERTLEFLFRSYGYEEQKSERRRIIPKEFVSRYFDTCRTNGERHDHDADTRREPNDNPNKNRDIEKVGMNELRKRETAINERKRRDTAVQNDERKLPYIRPYCTRERSTHEATSRKTITRQRVTNATGRRETGGQRRTNGQSMATTETMKR